MSRLQELQIKKENHKTQASSVIPLLSSIEQYRSLALWRVSAWAGTFSCNSRHYTRHNNNWRVERKREECKWQPWMTLMYSWGRQLYLLKNRKNSPDIQKVKVKSHCWWFCTWAHAYWWMQLQFTRTYMSMQHRWLWERFYWSIGFLAISPDLSF